MQRVACVIVLFVSSGDILADPFLLTPNAEGRYEFQDLSFPGSTFTNARAINNQGTVVGYYSDGNSIPIKWIDGEIRPLEQFANDPSSHPRRINDEGVIVGQSFPDPFNLGRAVVWNGDDLQDLGTLGGEGAAADDINNRGEIVGASRFPGKDDLEPFFWSQDGGMQFIGNLGSEDSTRPGFSVARAVNNRGEVVGLSNRKAFIWSAETGMLNLGILPGYDVAHASDINDLGQVVGWNRQLGGGIDTAFLWTAEGGVLTLGAFEGVDSSAAAINNHETVVGSYGRERRTAFLWEDGVATNLNDLVDLPDPRIWLRSAHDINDRGQIIGFYATIPEPSSPLHIAIVLVAGICFLHRHGADPQSGTGFLADVTRIRRLRTKSALSHRPPFRSVCTLTRSEESLNLQAGNRPLRMERHPCCRPRSPSDRRWSLRRRFSTPRADTRFGAVVHHPSPEDCPSRRPLRIGSSWIGDFSEFNL